MSIQFYKIAALFRKDLKDALKNGNCMLLCILPLGMTALYTFLDIGGVRMDRTFVLSIGLLMNLSLLPLATTSMMIAEEKEKFTLRTLMLSNVSAVEFLASKALVIYLLMQAVNLAVYALVGTQVLGLGAFLLITTGTSLCMILFGALIGVLSKNQMNTGMLSSPLALLFLLPAMLAQLSEGIARYARFLPTHAMLALLGEATDARGFSMAVILGWTVLAAVLFAWVYQRKRLD